MNPSILAVHASGMHTMSKHRSRVRANPTQPNLQQVHLIHSELFDELRERDFEIRARNWTV